jgi:hypothetical protein
MARRGLNEFDSGGLLACSKLVETRKFGAYHCSLIKQTQTNAGSNKDLYPAVRLVVTAVDSSLIM